MLDSGNSQYLSRTPGVAGNQQKWTVSTWVKHSKLGALQELFGGYINTSTYGVVRFNNADQIEMYATNAVPWFTTSAVFRDPSAWYHIVIAYDSANATANQRVRLFVNGTEQTSFAADNRASYQNQNSAWNSTSVQSIGVDIASPGGYLDGYMSDFYSVDGQVLTPSSFAQADPTTGQWLPKAYTGTYGTNGFHLSFSSGASLGADSSGSGNNWTTNGGIAAANNQVIDTPNNNFATWNPIHMGTYATLSSGSLNVSVSSTGGDG